MARPTRACRSRSCDTKLVPLANGKSIAPLFNVFTDVPIPGRFWGLLVDDLNFSTDPTQINYGEKAGIPFAPVGIYDYTNRLVHTTESDHSGLFDVLMPSTNRINCPTPSGVCANVYRFVGNDPGAPGNLNTNYKPGYRTIAAEFEAVPGQPDPGRPRPDPGRRAQCSSPAASRRRSSARVAPTAPQLFAVDKPYVTGSRLGHDQGAGLRCQQGHRQVTLDGTALPTTSWNDTTIVATVPTNVAAGPHQLMVTQRSGATTVNGLTFHVLAATRRRRCRTSTSRDSFNRSNSNTLGSNWSQVDHRSARPPLGSTATRPSGCSQARRCGTAAAATAARRRALRSPSPTRPSMVS